LGLAGDGLENHTIADARVERRRGLVWEQEKPANPLGSGQGQRVETKPTFALKAYRGSFL
jgi:hypothetical protein